MRLTPLLLLAACNGKAEPDTDTDTTPIDDPADNVAVALGDCLGYYRDPGEYPNQLTQGSELERYTLEDPEAVCNDGTRAVVYVRAATDPTFANVWELHLQGGGGCSSWESCTQRWCGLDYYDSSKMSAEGLPEQIEGWGIFDTGAGVLKGANHVYFYYCSSDSWAGQGTVAYDAPEGSDSDDTGGIDMPEGLPDYTMYSRGHTIVAAAIDELEAGVVGDLGETMPSLRDATDVIFNGTSGGSVGVAKNTDWLTERLSANGTKVVAIMDAANSPPPSYFEEPTATVLLDAHQATWERRVSSSDTPPFGDESCHVLLGGTVDEWKCDQQGYTLLNHVTTPFFARHDLGDVADPADSHGVARDDWEVAMERFLLDLAAIPENGVEGDDVTIVPGVYGPNCGQHVALEMNNWWRETTVVGADGIAYSFQDAVVVWYQGSRVQIVDDPVTGPADGPRSVCAKVE